MHSAQHRRQRAASASLRETSTAAGFELHEHSAGFHAFSPQYVILALDEGAIWSIYPRSGPLLRLAGGCGVDELDAVLAILTPSRFMYAP